MLKIVVRAVAAFALAGVSASLAQEVAAPAQGGQPSVFLPSGTPRQLPGASVVPAVPASPPPADPAVAVSAPPAADPAAPPSPVEPMLPPGVTLETAFGFDPTLAGGAPFKRDLATRFYIANGVHPVWTAGAPGSSAVPALLDLMAGAAAEGLEPVDYPVAKLKTLEADPAALGTFEVLMTSAVLDYINARGGGRLSRIRLPVEMRERGLPVDPVAVLNAALASPDMAAAVDAVGPHDSEYQALKALLARYRALAAAGGWPVLADDDGGKIEPGTADARIAAIRARLAKTDAAGRSNGPADLYDQELIGAVKSFQKRHGLTPDGVIGRGTLNYFAQSVQYRIMQIVVNMERRRQNLPDLGPDFIIVNIPEYKLRYYEGGNLMLETAVVVGQMKRQTPLLQSKITNIVVNPTWTVPQRLAGEDIVRKVLANPNYIEEHGFQIYSGWGADATLINPASIDWENMPRNKSFPYRLRQGPGAGNSLGRLKINFDNPYAVYLHDTPERHLFARDLRALSSGCVRVKNPLDLIEKVVAGVPGWDRQRIEKMIGGPADKPTYVIIRRPIGVRFTYVTAWVDAKGVPHFRDDIYGIDRLIARGLSSSLVVAAGG